MAEMTKRSLPALGANGTARTRLQVRPPPSLTNKLARAAWGVVRVLLFRPTPAPLHGWRRLILRVFGAQVGARVAVYPGAQIWAPWNLSIASGATIGGGAIIYNVDHVAIGKYAVVSQGAHLCTASHAHNSPGFELVTAPIRIEDEAWVAAEAFVGPGVTIGRAALVGARAVAIKSIADRAIVAGNPARVVGRRSAEGRNRLGGRAHS